jgi:hypothetical protein
MYNIRTTEYLTMVKRLDWERRRFDGRKKTSVTDETEFRKDDVAARWIAQAEAWQVHQRKLADIRERNRQDTFFPTGKSRKPRKR